VITFRAVSHLDLVTRYFTRRPYPPMEGGPKAKYFLRFSSYWHSFGT